MFKTLWRKIILGIAGALLAIGGAGAGYKIIKEKITHNDPEKDRALVEVVDVIDGDTIKIKDNIRVRLLTIDSPEKGECYYEESRQFARDLLMDKTVRLEKDISGEDKYERLLRYVILPSEEENEDDLIVNEYMARQGMAKYVASPPDNRYRDLISTAQEEAKRERRGLWGACQEEDNEAAALREEDSQPADPECIIKGNISEKGYGKTYLIPGCDNYNQVKIDTRKGEQYFCTEAEATAAGFRKAQNCP